MDIISLQTSLPDLALAIGATCAVLAWMLSPRLLPAIVIDAYLRGMTASVSRIVHAALLTAFVHGTTACTHNQLADNIPRTASIRSVVGP